MDSIAIVVPELLPVPPVQGGAVEHWVDEASWRLIKPNRKLIIVSRPAGIAGRTGIEYIGIPWTSLERYFHRLKERVTWKNPLRHLAKIQNVFSYGWRMAKVVRNFDIIYLHNEPNLLLFLRKQPGQKIILHMHNTHLSIPWLRLLYRRVLAKVDVIICVSDYIRQQALPYFPEHANRFQIMFNATDPDLFKPYGEESLHQLANVIQFDMDKRYLLYVGRLTPIKGVDTLITAFRDIYQRMPNVRLIIAGSSFFGSETITAYEQKLVTLAQPIADAIIFTGYLPHEKLKYLYSAADVVIFPSVGPEAFGLVMIEAMAAGTCLVASRVGGIPEVLEHGVNGLLVDPADANGLAHTIYWVLDNPDKKHQMETSARQTVLNGFTWERLVANLETLFGSLK